jgi:hypothetical protein
MASSIFDTYIDLWRADGPYVGFDDDVVLGVDRNSQLDIILPGAAYVIGANSFDPFKTGAYTVTAAARPAEMNGCRAVWVTRGVTVSDSITTADCADSAVTPHHYDVARIVGLSGTVITVAERSTALNPSLALYQINGNGTVRTLVASNDDSLAGTNTNAFIAYTVAATPGAIFDVVIGTSTGGETGAYTFEVSASSTLSARRSGPVPGRRDWWLSAGSPLKRSKR